MNMYMMIKEEIIRILHFNLIYQKIISKMNEQSLTRCSLKRCQKQTHICRLTPTLEVLRRSISGCVCVLIAMATPNLPQTKYSFLQKLHISSVVEFSPHHQAFMICSFPDTWGLLMPRGVVGRVINQTQSQPSHPRWQESDVSFGTDICLTDNQGKWFLLKHMDYFYLCWCSPSRERYFLFYGM